MLFTYIVNLILKDRDKSLFFFENTKTDPRFVGVWKGTDHGKFFKGETNSWIINRKADGTMYITFKTIHADDEVTYAEEKGVWCVIGDEYFEFRESDQNKDQYSFLFLSNNSIHFTINEEKSGEEPYNFVDFKMLLD